MRWDWMFFMRFSVVMGNKLLHSSARAVHTDIGIMLYCTCGA